MSIVRDNLMNEEGYSPYCGRGYSACTFRMPRTTFTDDQFECRCGWRSEFPDEFIEEYKKKWEIE